MPEILSLNGGYVNSDFRTPRTFGLGEICRGKVEVRSGAVKPTALYLNGGFGAWHVHDVRVNERSQFDGDEFSGEVFSPRRHREMFAIVSGFDTVTVGGAFEVEASFLGKGSVDRAPFYAVLMGVVVGSNHPVDSYSGLIRLRGVDGQLVTATCDGPSRVLPGESAWFVARPDQALHPEHFMLERYSQDWMIEDLHVDGKSQFVTGSAVPGDIFHPDVLDWLIKLHDVSVSGSFAIKARYVGSNPRGGRFGALVRVRVHLNS
jgi:hypothetical protein